MRRAEPSAIRSARFPIRSARSPKSGVANIAVSGRRPFRKPAVSGETPRASVKKMFAKRRNGKTAE